MKPLKAIQRYVNQSMLILPREKECKIKRSLSASHSQNKNNTTGWMKNNPHATSTRFQVATLPTTVILTTQKYTCKTLHGGNCIYKKIKHEGTS